MRNPGNSPYGRDYRISTSGTTRNISESHSYSPSSYSTVSTTGKESTSRRNPVVVLARAVAGVIGSCFFPPPDQKKDCRSVDVSDEFKVPVLSNTRASSERSASKQGIYSGLHHTANAREPGSVKYTIDEIYKATGNFSPSYKIGQGGFGTVYRGTLADGTLVAVKRAKKNVCDEHLGSEFQSEIQTLSQVEHSSLVRFYGCLEHEDERVVVVEYVPNGTLREHLDCKHRKVLDLAGRLDIAIDVAHGVTYLHMYTDRPIIHRDIKSSNILLTEKYRAKVADFGFARMVDDSECGDTHIDTQVKGTAGYLDPEYLRTYQLTEKSDVYSFGVLLVELLSGRRPIETKRHIKERITAKWAIKNFNDGNAIATLDPRLDQTDANTFAVEKILELSFRCLAPRRQERPIMRRCAEILWSIRKDYKELASSDTRYKPSKIDDLRITSSEADQAGNPFSNDYVPTIFEIGIIIFLQTILVL